MLGTIGVTDEGEAEGFCLADELVLSSASSPAAQGQLTGRVHLAFQPVNRQQVDAILPRQLGGGRDNGASPNSIGPALDTCDR